MYFEVVICFIFDLGDYINIFLNYFVFDKFNKSLIKVVIKWMCIVDEDVKDEISRGF